MNIRIHAMAGLSAAILVSVLSAGCSQPPPPETGAPPEPQTPPAAEATELRDAIRQPLDQAEAAKRAADEAAKAQRAAIDEATGG